MSRLRLATGADGPLLAGPGLFPTPDAPLTTLELLDAESRLLAQAVGGHLPLELALQVESIRARRAALLTGP